MSSSHSLFNLSLVLNYNKSRLDIPAQQNFSCFSCPKKSNHMDQIIKPCVLLQRGGRGRRLDEKMPTALTASTVDPFIAAEQDNPTSSAILAT